MGVCRGVKGPYAQVPGMDVTNHKHRREMVSADVVHSFAPLFMVGDVQAVVRRLHVGAFDPWADSHTALRR